MGQNGADDSGRVAEILFGSLGITLVGVQPCRLIDFGLVIDFWHFRNFGASVAAAETRERPPGTTAIRRLKTDLP